MSYGLQVFNSSGVTVLEVTDRITRFHSQVDTSLAPSETKYIAVTGMSTDGTWAIVCNNFYVKSEIQGGQIMLQNMNSASTISASVLVFRM